MRQAMQNLPILKVLLSFGYVFVVLGSVGMIVFATKFGFSTHLGGYRNLENRYLGMDGACVWWVSWCLIIAGTVLQLIGYWVG